ncbi:MAG: carbohydrate binding family 9 domain-containing protein [Deltaproteobacteria bacterium]|nr:carbohydrate binding family 9 domain-containing protein [Deltaproteobacteria bacterium]
MLRALVPVSLFALVAAAPTLSFAERPEVTAYRLTSRPRIDGRLDDEAWRSVPAVGAFVQRRPDPGAPASERTELRVAYDDDALYVAIRLHDREPGRIRRALARRDSMPDSDAVVVFLDPLLSRERAFAFGVNASGVVMDGTVSGETNLDTAWDGVFRAAASVDAGGWGAELRIPFSSLPVQDQPLQRWGLCVFRNLQRRQEESFFPVIPKDSNTFVSRFADLTGLRGLQRRGAWRLQPYLGAELQLGRGEDTLRPPGTFFPSGGLDLRYNAAGELLAVASLNPDFGQVDADPAVVNLSPTESFYGEKRPFFVEGAELFRTPMTLLHTRRIGAAPPEPDPERGGKIVELPTQARILEALKVLGQSETVSYGLLSATVLPTSAVEALPTGQRLPLAASPGSHYGAARLKVSLGRVGNVGALVTGLTRPGEVTDTDAYVGGLDWDLRSHGGWQATGQTALGHTSDGFGLGLVSQLGLMGAPRVRYWLETEAYSPRFDPNAVGYLWRRNMVLFRGHLQHRLPSPTRRLLDHAATLRATYAFNMTRPELAFERRVELDTWWRFRNRLELWPGGGVRFFSWDDRETRGGPAYGRPYEPYVWLGGKTDPTRRVFGESTFTLGLESGGFEAGWFGTLTATALWDRLSFSVYGRVSLKRDLTRWVETQTVAGRDRYLFAALSQEELEVKPGATLALHRALVLQLYAQLLYSVGRYPRAQELQQLADGSTTLGETPLRLDANFSVLRLFLNAVLRWDLGDGTAAFLVYKLDGGLDRTGGPQPFELFGELRDLAARPQTHLLLLKVSYGWNF